MLRYHFFKKEVVTDIITFQLAELRLKKAKTVVNQLYISCRVNCFCGDSIIPCKFRKCLPFFATPYLEYNFGGNLLIAKKMCENKKKS